MFGKTWKALPGPASLSESPPYGEDRMTEGKLGLVVPSDSWSSLIVQKDSPWDALKELALLGTF